MIDLISRQAAQAVKVLPKCYREYNTNNLDDAYEKGWEDAMLSLNALSTIDPVKHGKWELHEYPDGYYHTECSECGAVYDEMVYFLKKAHYCPNCGARNDRSEE